MNPEDGMLTLPLANELVRLGWLTDSQARALVEHVRPFPTYPLNRLFLEYQLRSPGMTAKADVQTLKLEGYGPGYTLPQYEEFLAEGSAAIPEAQAAAIRRALARDPFMSERGQYVEWRLGGDVDWLEYDYAGESFAADPALFFVPPARFQTLADAKHLNGFETALAKAIGFETRTQRRERGEHDKPALFDLLDALRERSVPGNGPPLSAYRLGVSDNRAPGWVKLIVNGVQVDALRAALTAISLPFEDVFTPVEKLYKDFGGPEQEPIIGLSIDSLYGDIAGVDVECPYFNGLDIPQPRTDALQRFTSGLCERQVLTAELAERINAACYREFMDETHEARLFMNHFKFGIAGRTRGRLKAYFEVNTRRQAS